MGLLIVNKNITNVKNLAFCLCVLLKFAMPSNTYACISNFYYKLFASTNNYWLLLFSIFVSVLHKSVLELFCCSYCFIYFIF